MSDTEVVKGESQQEKGSEKEPVSTSSDLGLGFSSFAEITKITNGNAEKPKGLELNKLQISGDLVEGKGRMICDENRCIIVPEGGLGEKGIGDFSFKPGQVKVDDVFEVMNRFRQMKEGQSQFGPVIPGFNPAVLQRPEGGRGPHMQPPFQIGDGRLLQRIQHLADQPMVREMAQRIGADLGINFDQERGELELKQDFGKFYDMAVPKDSPDYSEDVRKSLANLDSMRLSADKVTMNYNGEQILPLGDKGIAALYKMAIGADKGQTSMSVDTTETSLTLSNIKGMQIVENSGRRLNIHKINLDSSDPDNPKGSIEMDNPLPKMNFIGKVVPRSETVTVPLLLPKEQMEQLKTTLPKSTRTLDAVRSAVKTGDMSKLLENVNLADLTSMLNWGYQNRGTIDFQSSWRSSQQDALKKAYEDAPSYRRGPFDNVRR